MKKKKKIFNKKYNDKESSKEHINKVEYEIKTTINKSLQTELILRKIIIQKI